MIVYEYETHLYRIITSLLYSEPSAENVRARTRGGQKGRSENWICVQK